MTTQTEDQAQDQGPPPREGFISPVEETEENLVVEEVPVQAPPPAPPPEPTFNQKLQTAIASFSTSVSAVSAASIGVETAENELVAVEAQLLAANAGKDAKLSDMQVASASAIVSRDGLIAVLQSWTP